MNLTRTRARALVAALFAAALAPVSASANACTIVAAPTAENYTDCPGVDLEFADLSGIDLSYANLSGADLHGANLRNTVLASASLSGAALYSANLTGAVLDDADLSGASLANATVSDTILVPQDQMLSARSAAGAPAAWTRESLPGATPGDCSPAAGSVFPLGTTSATCAVLDDSGEAAHGTFTVSVIPSASSMRARPALLSFDPVNAATLSATLSLPDGAPAGAGLTIRFTSGTTTLCTDVTDETGTATCMGGAEATQTLLLAGEYQARFTTTSWLLGSNASAGLL